MLNKQRKKQSSSNINININLKVQSKSGTAGRKISQNKEVSKNSQGLRPTQLYKNKKHSAHQTHPSKESIHQYLEEHPLFEQQTNNFTHRNQRESQKVKSGIRKRMKSKSLQNFKVRYYAHTPDIDSKSHSKNTSKSKSRVSSKSKSKSKSQKKKISQISPRSFLHSAKKKSKSKERSKSKSKSPLLSKKRSLQTFRVSSRQIQRQKSKEKKNEKNTTTVKKSQPSFEKNSKYSFPAKKSSQLEAKVKYRKSKQKIKMQTSPKKKQVDKKKIQKPKYKKTRKSKNEKIFSHVFLNLMATKIQKVWRGYCIRKQFKEDLNKMSQSITKLKKNELWESHSSHSIIQLQNDFGRQKTQSKNYSQRSNNDSMNSQFMAELEKLRKKLQQQQDKFKMLAQENNQLKANLSKINQQYPSSEKKKKELAFNNKVLSMRIQSEESQIENNSESQNYLKRFEKQQKRKQKMLSLEPLIKTQESKEDINISQLKKKVEHFDCSPRNKDKNIFKFNKPFIKKLFSLQQQKVNEKYLKKNHEYKILLENSLVSPKTYHQKSKQWEFKLKKQQQQTINKYKQAEKALLFIAELQNQQNSQLIENKQKLSNIEQYHSPLLHTNKSNHSSSQSTPQRKTINININVDEIQSNHDKYPPILSHHSARQNQIDFEENLSQLYHKAMDQQRQHKKQQNERKIKQISPQIKKNLTFQTKQNGSNEEQIKQYPEFKIEYLKNSSKIQGFETSLKYIRCFYIKFCQFFRDIPSLREEILNNIMEEITFDSELYLKSFRVLSEEEEKSDLVFPYFKFLANYNIAVPIFALNAFFSELINEDSEMLYCKEVHQMKKTSNDQHRQYGYSSYQLKQYFDLALIDAFNEAINFQRPGGSEASNLDSLTNKYCCIFKRKIYNKISPKLSSQERESNLNQIFGDTICRIVNFWASCLCGFINDSDEESEKIDESKIEEVRTRRLTLLLESHLIEEEHTFTQNQPFELYVKLQLSKIIFDQLAQQACQEIIF